MNISIFTDALVAATQWVLEHPGNVLLAVVAFTVLGVPLRRVIGSAAALVRVPAAFGRSEVAPVLARSAPWGLTRMLRGLRSYFGPVLDRPGRALARAIRAVWLTIGSVQTWPVGPIVDAFVGLVFPMMEQTASRLESACERIASASRAALDQLHPKAPVWVGWRVIGGLLFFIGLCFFVFADAALSIASHEVAISAPVTFLPPIFHEVTLAYAIASFVSALMLGLVIST